MAGLTAEGFEAKSYAEILADVEARQLAAPALGADVDLSPEQPLGQINGSFCATTREVWELAAGVYAARDPRGASGDALTDASLLTGTERRGAQRAVAPLAVTLAAGATLPAGSVGGHVSDTTRQFATQTSVTNAGVAQATLGVLATQVAAGPVPDGTVVTNIVTPVAGWVSVESASAILPGTLAEGDPALRRRRDLELQSAGSSPADAIRAALLGVPLVIEAVVWTNNTDSVDADGRPPHSVEAIVHGGAASSTIALALFRATAAGIQTWGAIIDVVGDALGRSHTVRFSAPQPKPVFARAFVEVDPSVYPDTIAGNLALLTAVRAAIVGAGAPLGIGAYVSRGLLTCAVRNLAGVRDCPTVATGFSAPTVVDRARLDVGPRERATFASGDIEVTRV